MIDKNERPLGRVKLSERLTVIAGMCGEKIRTLADVGCDHGWLGISLLLEERVTHVIGMDLREGPLSRARENAAASGLSTERFETRLSDGLDALSPGEADVIVMAGIGGVLMCRLLTRGIEVAKKASRLVLSPQSHIESVRELLAAEGFSVTDENMCRESGKYYTVMSVHHRSLDDAREETCVAGNGEDTCAAGNGEAGKADPYAYTLSDEELFFGPVLIKKGEPLFKEYVHAMGNKAKKRLSEINRKNREEGEDPAEHFEKLLASAKKILGNET